MAFRERQPSNPGRTEAGIEHPWLGTIRRHGDGQLNASISIPPAIRPARASGDASTEVLIEAASATADLPALADEAASRVQAALGGHTPGTMDAAVLVTHPQGDFLIAAGFGADIAAHIHAPPWYARCAYRAASTAGDQLDASGYDRGRLRGVLITHSHLDHVSGLDQLQVPIWTNAGELQYAADSRGGTAMCSVTELDLRDQN